jgi:hypothetical protein
VHCPLVNNAVIASAHVLLFVAEEVCGEFRHTSRRLTLWGCSIQHRSFKVPNAGVHSLAMTLHDWTPSIHALAMRPDSRGSGRHQPRIALDEKIRVEGLTLAEALEAATTARVPLNVGSRPEQAVDAPRPALLPEGNPNAMSQLDIEACPEGSRAREARRGCSIRPCDSAHTVGSIAALETSVN